jgi:hypothetical protein
MLAGPQLGHTWRRLAAYGGHSESAPPASVRLRPRGVEYFQAGHASSILVTRSITKRLVRAILVPAVNTAATRRLKFQAGHVVPCSFQTWMTNLLVTRISPWPGPRLLGYSSPGLGPLLGHYGSADLESTSGVGRRKQSRTQRPKRLIQGGCVDADHPPTDQILRTDRGPRVPAGAAKRLWQLVCAPRGSTVQ